MSQTYSICTTVTASDTASNHYNALYIGGTGGADIVVVARGAEAEASITFTNVPTGTLLPIKTEKVKSTGTDTALVDIIGLN